MDPTTLFALITAMKGGRDTAVMALLVFIAAIAAGMCVLLGLLISNAGDAFIAVLANCATVCVGVVMVTATLGFVAIVIHLVYRLFSSPPTVRRL